MNFLMALLIVLTSVVPARAAAGQAEDIDKVQAAFEEVLSQDPRNRDALFMLGLIYEKKRRTPDALRVWKQYRSIETDAEKRGIAEKHIHQLSQ